MGLIDPRDAVTNLDGNGCRAEAVNRYEPVSPASGNSRGPGNLSDRLPSTGGLRLDSLELQIARR
jgi:hypothetical protein